MTGVAVGAYLQITLLPLVAQGSEDVRSVPTLPSEPLPDRVLRHHARLDELQQVVRPACLRSDAGQPVSPERLSSDTRPGDPPVHVHVAGAEILRGAADVHRRAREDAARERVVGVVREREGVLEVVRAEDDQHRPEDLLARDPCPRVSARR